MLRDITIGQYYREDSVIHTLDPRVKIVAVFLYIILLFVCTDTVCYVTAAAFLGMIIILSKIPVRFIFRGMKAIFWIIFMSVVLHLFFTEGHVLVQFHGITITVEGIKKVVMLAIRLFLLIIASSMLTLTTMPSDLTDGLEKMLHFLNYLRIPVHDIAMMMTIALRFIPILMEEADKIIKAQTARGADFETGGILRRLKAMIPVLLPLFVAAFRRAEDLSLAMEARCYRGGKGRTKMKPLKYRREDYVAYLILMLFIGGMVAEKFFC